MSVVTDQASGATGQREGSGSVAAKLRVVAADSVVRQDLEGAAHESLEIEELILVTVTLVVLEALDHGSNAGCHQPAGALNPTKLKASRRAP
jgi:hypothetical protein